MTLTLIESLKNGIPGIIKDYNSQLNELEKTMFLAAKNLDFEKNKILRAKEAASERNFLEVKNFWELGVPNGKLCLIKNFVREKFKTKITEIVKEFKPDVLVFRYSSY